MKKLTTAICCIMLATFGWLMHESKYGLPVFESTPVNAAALKPYQGFEPPILPLDVQMDLQKNLPKDTVFVTDTVYTVREAKPKVVTKYRNVYTTDTIETKDTLFVPIVLVVPQEQTPQIPLTEVPDTFQRQRAVMSNCNCTTCRSHLPISALYWA